MDYFEQSLRRKMEIEDGLLELMASTRFSQITVTELTTHLGMSRKCFYHYFSGKEACLESLIDRMIRDAALFLATADSSPVKPLQNYVQNLEYWKAHGGFLEIIVQNGLDTVLLHRYMLHHIREERSANFRLRKEDIFLDEDILFFCASGLIGLLLRWCQRGFDTPVEEMAKKFRRLLQMPLIQHIPEAGEF